ncbi:hypothetical protein CLOP_g15841 [Closterium sp. NIES-67]|nr:hypothetical protein CLOP_g15841 [Closterium sp. NIES-67]
MELQGAAEEEGVGKAEAVGGALAEVEAEVTIMRGMGAPVAGGVPEWRAPAGTARSCPSSHGMGRLQQQQRQQRQRQQQEEMQLHQLMGSWKQSRKCSSSRHMASTTGPAKTPLALVHMDVVGPTRAPSLSGSRYFLTIWKASEDEEFGSLIENETWDLCDLPPGKKAITSKMIYRHKLARVANLDGLVGKGQMSKLGFL